MANNVLNRYLFKDLSVRGELVQLDETYQQIISSKDYPAPVQTLLGELLVAATLLTATIKFEGSITLQLQGDGPVSLAVINGDNQQQVRGVARYSDAVPDNASLHELLGKGYLIITIEPKQGERYQGIVALEGKNLAEVLEGYFARSEQLKTRLWIHTGAREGQQHAAGMLIQVMPDGTGTEDDFERLETLTDTITSQELFSLDAHELLYRLYNQETLSLYSAQDVTFRCGCSREKSGAAIITLPIDDVQTMLEEDGKIELHCDYCGATYAFDKDQVAELFINAKNQADNDTIH